MIYYNNEAKFLWLQWFIHTCEATITVFGKGADAAAIAGDRNSKQVISKSCAESTDCISEISNTKIDNANELDNVMRSYNLIDYSLKYAQTSGSLLQNCRDDPGDNNIKNSE